MLMEQLPDKQVRFETAKRLGLIGLDLALTAAEKIAVWINTHPFPEKGYSGEHFKHPLDEN